MIPKASIAASSQATRVRLFFDQTSDEKLLVLVEVLSSQTPEVASQLSVHTFEHEDLFLERLIFASLTLDETSSLAATVIRSVDPSTRSRTWMETNLTEEQIATLGLDLEQVFTFPMAIQSEDVLRLEESREDTLFKQWAELEAIYRTAPAGMALLDAGSLRLMRINEKYAEMMGSPTFELLWKKALDLQFVPSALASLFRRIEAGETVRNAIVEKAVVLGAVGHRTWLVSISPFFGASGEVLAFTSIALEIPDEN